MILYINISKIKNIKIPPTYVFLVMTFCILTQLIRLCQPTKKELKMKSLLYISIDYIHDSSNLTSTMFITCYFIFYVTIT